MTKRSGDTVSIGGDYQHKAAESPNAVQRFWHHTKRLITQDLLPPAPNDQCLELGCGSGVLCGFLGETAEKVVGIDANEEAIAFARKTYGSSRVQFRRGLLDEDFPLEFRPDKIYCMEVIEHVYEDQARAMLGLFEKILAPGGQALLTTPNYASLWPIIEWGMDRARLAPRMKDEQHVCKFTPKRIEALCQGTELELADLRTFCFIAPWAAPLSWPLALRLHGWEVGSRNRLGSIIGFLLRRSD